MLSLIPTAIARKVAMGTLVAQKNAPSLLFGAGVLGTIGSTVLACRATLKMEEVVETTQNDLTTAKALVHEEYSEQDRKKDITIIYSRAIIRTAKLYGPSLILGAASICCLTKSHNLLMARNEALTAAYVAVDQAFKRYRGKVVDKYGEDEDRKLRYDLEEREEWDAKKGKMMKVIGPGPEGESMYARFFDERSDYWGEHPEYNLTWLLHKQNYANDLLISRGHLFLNEVYEMLDIEHSKAGAVVGWVRSGDGDSYVDFGIHDADRQTARNFVNGREGSILLDFNVDGVIWDLLDDDQRDERIRWQ